MFVEAVLWVARTGSPWRNPPPLFGKWNTVFKRYSAWRKSRGVFERLFEALSDDPDMEYAMMGGTVVKLHRHGQGAKGISMRSDKTDQAFRAMIYLADAAINSR